MKDFVESLIAGWRARELGGGELLFDVSNRRHHFSLIRTTSKISARVVNKRRAI